jgi:hypothetical protein
MFSLLYQPQYLPVQNLHLLHWTCVA